MYAVHYDELINSKNLISPPPPTGKPKRPHMSYSDYSTVPLFFLPPPKPPSTTQVDLTLIAPVMQSAHLWWSYITIKEKIENCEKSSQQPSIKSWLPRTLASPHPWL